MRIPYYQVNAFTNQDFGGNPAGVCLLHEWLPTPVLQKIAAENNLSETAFLVRRDGFFDLRWMTPVTEVDLCGHATLAAAHVLFREESWTGEKIRFHTISGPLSVGRRQDLLELDFPSRPALACPVPARLSEALGAAAKKVLKARDYLVVFDSAAEVAALRPDMVLLATFDGLGIIATAPSEEVDFVSRFFAPKVGVPEDPVTGSAHCTLIPYWAGVLDKAQLRAWQISARRGELFCRWLGERVGIAGEAVVYCRGELDVRV